MKFIIRRTTHYEESAPIKGAFKMMVPYWHTRTCTEEYFDKHFAPTEGKWRSKGKNHKKIKANYNHLSKGTWISRQEEDREVWAIEINSLEELIAFEKKYGDIIISTYQDNEGDEDILVIEIYDGYRE